MRDQLAHLPPALPAAMLWRGQNRSEALATLAALSVRSWLSLQFIVQLFF